MREAAKPVGGLSPPLTIEARDFQMAEQSVPQPGPCVHHVGIVYGLVSAEDPDRIRYVGFTKRRLSERMKNHRSEAFKGRRKAVSVWVADLIATDTPYWAVILKTEATYADEVEIISRLRGEGADLLNETAGGMGTHGRALTPAMLAAFGLAASEKQRETVRTFNASRDYTTAIAALRAFQSNPENLCKSGAAISAAKAKHTPERKAEILAKRRATLARKAAASSTTTDQRTP